MSKSSQRFGYHDLVVKEYTLYDGEMLRLRVFRTVTNFRNHLIKHVIRDRKQPWNWIIEVSKIKTWCQIQDQPDDTRWKEAYETFAEALDQCIRKSISQPLYVCFAESREARGRVVAQITDGYRFVSPEGLQIVAYGGAVRSAYFPSMADGDSPTTLFYRTVENTQMCVQVGKKHGRQDEQVGTYTKVEYITRDSWARAAFAAKYPLKPKVKDRRA